MAMPTLTEAGTQLYEATPERILELDAATDYTWAKFVAARAAMLDLIFDLVSDTDAGEGWSALLDPYRCPEALLPWLAQWEGVDIPPGLAAVEIRALIDEAPAQRRGTPWSIVAFVQRYLTGTRQVIMRERYTGDPSLLYLRTLTSETPDPAWLLSALVKFHKPGGLILDYATVTGGTYGMREASFATYAAAEAAFATYGAAEEG